MHIFEYQAVQYRAIFILRTRPEKCSTTTLSQLQWRKRCKDCAIKACYFQPDVLICVIGTFQDRLKGAIVKLCCFLGSSWIQLLSWSIRANACNLSRNIFHASTKPGSWFGRYWAPSIDHIFWVWDDLLSCLAVRTSNSSAVTNSDILFKMVRVITLSYLAFFMRI